MYTENIRTSVKRDDRITRPRHALKLASKARDENRAQIYPLSG